MCQAVGHFGRFLRSAHLGKSLFSKRIPGIEKGGAEAIIYAVNGKIFGPIRSYRRTYDNGDNHKNKIKKVPSIT